MNMIKDMMKTFDNRRQQLHKALKFGSLDAAKQHQIYGAINELNMVLRTMKYQHEQWLKMEGDVHKMSRETHEEQMQEFDAQLQEIRQQPFKRLPDPDEPFDERFRNEVK